MVPFLLITDLDNTLVGDDRATQTLNQQLQSRRSQFCLVYSTGRSLASTQELMAERQLLTPDFLITGVGTAIYRWESDFGSAQLSLDVHWADRLSEGWQRGAISALAQQFEALIPQPAGEQNPWKLSFWLDSPEAEAIVLALQTALAQQGHPAQVVFSSGRDVDILPELANKGNATAYLQKTVEIESAATIVCGDSGNDISLFEQANWGIIVQNAQPEMLQWYNTCGRSGHYLARSPYAWGILEGLNYFHQVL
uniref:sucrose-phosphate phosphatase n=1 Tax=Cyanothece sp. (strain PCC 7425 / ATCC 29141) TaxID=395961 RepID=B8HKQ6_CYAP4